MASKKLICLLESQTRFLKPNNGVIAHVARNKATWDHVEKETHTGQKWDENDYRLVRFVDKEKHVNPNWSVKLISEVPPAQATKRIVSCDGGGGPTGHPKVFINLDKPGNHTCGYCGLRFYKDDHHH